MNCSNEEKTRSSGLEVPCFFIGLGAGIVLTMLYAPMSGDATRRLISRRAKQGQDWVEDQASAASDFVTERAESISHRVKDVVKAAGVQ